MEDRGLFKSSILDNPLIKAHYDPLVLVGLVVPQMDKAQYLYHAGK